MAKKKAKVAALPGAHAPHAARASDVGCAAVGGGGPASGASGDADRLEPAAPRGPRRRDHQEHPGTCPDPILRTCDGRRADVLTRGTCGGRCGAWRGGAWPSRRSPRSSAKLRSAHAPPPPRSRLRATTVRLLGGRCEVTLGRGVQTMKTLDKALRAWQTDTDAKWEASQEALAAGLAALEARNDTLAQVSAHVALRGVLSGAEEWGRGGR
eukprot:1636214-Rhodomonas_salina.1